MFAIQNGEHIFFFKCRTQKKTKKDMFSISFVEHKRCRKTILQSELAEKVDKKMLCSPNQMKNKRICINNFELGADISVS